MIYYIPNLRKDGIDIEIKGTIPLGAARKQFATFEGDGPVYEARIPVSSCTKVIAVGDVVVTEDKRYGVLSSVTDRELSLHNLIVAVLNVSPFGPTRTFSKGS